MALVLRRIVVAGLEVVRLASLTEFRLWDSASDRGVYTKGTYNHIIGETFSSITGSIRRTYIYRGNIQYG